MGEEMFKKRRVRAIVAVLALLAAAASASLAFGATASPEASVRSFATGFASKNRVGPIGLAFGGGRLYVTDGPHLYSFGGDGGSASSHQVDLLPTGIQLAGLAFGADGGLYAVRRTSSTTGDVVEIDPATGVVEKPVAVGLKCPTSLVADPRTGDLFVSELWCGKDVVRISGGQVTPYVTGIAADGLTFAPDGTLYVAHAPDADGYTISSVTGTGDAHPGTRTPLAKLPTADGIALASSTGPGGRPDFLVVNRRDGAITRIDLDGRGNPTRDLAGGGTRGDLVAVGPDGCLYATQTSEILKITNRDGSCRRGPAQGGGPSGGNGIGIGIGLVPTTLVPTRPAPRPRALATVCRSNRQLVVRYRRTRGVPIAQARVYVGTRLAARVRGTALRRGVTVGGLPSRSFTLTIRAVTMRPVRGRALHVTVRRRLPACAGAPPAKHRAPARKRPARTKAKH